MKKFNIKKILIPLDFSETSLLALEHGTYMASLFQAELILFHAVKPNWTTFTIESSPAPFDVLAYQEKIGMEKLEQLSEKIRDEEKINVETLCKTGRVCPEILHAAAQHRADIIVMGTHGASGFEERFIGSNAYRVVNDSPCPVLTVQKHAIRKGFKDILLPIDNSFHSRQKVNHAMEFANHYGSRIHLLGLSHSEDEIDINKLKIRLEQVEELLMKHKILYDREINTGTNFGKMTIDYAEKMNYDLIMIMTEWEEDITGIFMGPFARQIVNHSKIPVISIRPEIKTSMIENGVMSWMEQH